MFRAMARPALHDRDETLTRARNLFWRRGFHATSLKDLEAALDMRPGSIYAAFGSKDGLYRLALQRYAEEMHGVLAAAQDGAADPLAGIAAFARAAGAMEEAPAAACMLARAIAEMTEEQAEARAEAERLVAGIEAEFAAGFAAARAAGIIGADADPALLAAEFLSRMFGIKIYAQRGLAPERARAMAEGLAAWVEALRRAPAGEGT